MRPTLLLLMRSIDQDECSVRVCGLLKISLGARLFSEVEGVEERRRGGGGERSKWGGGVNEGREG